MATQRHRKPENWIGAVARNGHGSQSEDGLEGEDRAREALLMGLRLHEGVDLARIAEQSGVAPSRLVDDRAIAQLTDIGLLRHHGTHLQVTPAGLLLLDAILPQVVAI